MRLFVFTRHGESSQNTANTLSSDPRQPVGLTPLGRRQARTLGNQIAHLGVDLAVATRFLRTQQTAQLALRNRAVPLLIEPALDELNAGPFDGAPIRMYWDWKEHHPRSQPFPGGESVDDALARYADAVRRLLDRSESVTLVVAHELPVRTIVEAAREPEDTQPSLAGIANAVPYLFDGRALARALASLEVLIGRRNASAA
jgi:broad specificity phosphatase PhoE